MRGSLTTPSRTPVIFTRTMLWLFIFGYSFFLVGQITYQNYKMNHEIRFEKDKIKELDQKKHTYQLALLYYQSTSYQEIEARQRLLLKGKDENVVALPQAKSEPILSVASDSVINKPPPPAIPPYQSWWNLFFGNES
jgi:hypothetical protein